MARRATALLAILGLLIHAALPLLHQARAASSPLGETTLICSGFGVKVVQLADLAGDESPQQPARRIYYCPICLASQLADAAILPAETALPVSTLTVLARIAAPLEAFAPQGHYPSLRARAPPSLA